MRGVNNEPTIPWSEPSDQLQTQELNGCGVRMDSGERHAPDWILCGSSISL